MTFPPIDHLLTIAVAISIVIYALGSAAARVISAIRAEPSCIAEDD